jgi:pyruvate formate-lyase activating enzyme-like uncharacterized protein
MITEDTEITEGIIVNGEDVDRLVHTSVDDLRTHIKMMALTGRVPNIWTLKVAHEECLDRGYKTKAKMLEAVIKKQEASR